MGKIDAQKPADNLKKEADELISSTGLNKILASYGEFFYTGSYNLDTMVWPDLDIEISLNGNPYSVETFFQLGSEISQLPGVKSMVFRNFLDSSSHESVPPKGLYWMIQVEGLRRPHLWKIDLWTFEKDILDKHIKEMEEFAAKISKDKRRLILQLKHSLLSKEGRTPISSGYHIYKAVLFHGIEDREGVIHYLLSKGVEIEE